MKKLIENFSSQLKEALQIAGNAKLNPSTVSINNVVVSGLGGSGIGGSMVSQIVESTVKVPILVTKAYSLPGFINENSLVIISSYSGNTEETLSCLYQAIDRKAKIVCITSGGKVEEIALAENLDLVKIPGGMPPRSCLGYSFVQLINVLTFFALIGKNYLPQFDQAIRLLDAEENPIQVEAGLIAKKLVNKTPVIYCADNMESVAIRFRQQLNENSKILCWHHVFPELNHNELVGWRDFHEDIAVILLRNNSDYERTKIRMEISKEIFKKYTSQIIEINSKGNSAIENAIYLVHLTDWVSYFLAEERGVDPVEVKVIDHLKSELAKA